MIIFNSQTPACSQVSQKCTPSVNIERISPRAHPTIVQRNHFWIKVLTKHRNQVSLRFPNHAWTYKLQIFSTTFYLTSHINQIVCLYTIWKSVASENESAARIKFEWYIQISSFTSEVLLVQMIHSFIQHQCRMIRRYNFCITIQIGKFWNTFTFLLTHWKYT